MPSITIEQAERAKRRVSRRRAVDDYARFLKTHRPPESEGDSESTTEPADPEHVDHEQRRQTRIAHPSFDVMKLPRPLVECGCGECPEYVDPLADEYGGAFDDVLTRADSMAYDRCESPQPVTVERAAEVAIRYQRAAENRDDWMSLQERTRARHGVIMDAERNALQRYDGNETVIFLSLRLSPVERVGGKREWVEPVKLDQRLHDSWNNMYQTMNNQLSGFEYEYIKITSTTVSAATPHNHVQIIVDDPNDEVTVDMARSMVNSHVNNTKGATHEDHPVEEGNRDAGMVFHDPPTADEIPEDTLIDVVKARGGEGFPPNTVTLLYAANQRPYWALDNVYNPASDVHADSVLVDGAAIAWAASHNWVTSSGGVDTSLP